MGTTATVRSRTIAAGCRRVSAMAERTASNEIDWLPAWRACAHPFVHPAGSVAKVSCTPMDQSDRNSRVAGWTLDRGSLLRSPEAWDCSSGTIGLAVAVAADVAC